MAADDDILLTVLLGRLERLNEAAVTAVCDRHDLSPSELRVLALLRNAAGLRGVRPTEIGRWIVQTSGGLAATLRRLEARGDLTRIPDPVDGRGRLVTLTDQGRDRYQLAFDDLVDHYEFVLRRVDTAAAIPIVSSLIDALERTSGRVPSGGWALPLEVSEPRR